MKCGWIESLIPRYFEGVLDECQLNLINQHVENCEDCGLELGAVDRLLDLVDNVEIEYVFENPPSMEYPEEDAVDPRNISISLRYSFIEMPENDFEPRLDDQRIGYFTERITDLSSKEITPYADLINKWNLKKINQEDELSPPKKPIIFWIENTTPKELREYIKKGVLAWNDAFEKAGFINAIEVKIQPNDADWDAGDIRYNVLRWTSSPNPPFGG